MASNLMMKRAFSTSTLLAQIVRPPIPVYGVEGRYAAALYSAAYKQKALDAVDKDLQDIKKLSSANKDFKQFVLDPTHNRLKKRDAVEAVMQKLGISKLSLNLIGVMAENGRLNKLDAVVNSFESIMRAHRGELYVEVTSAESLTKKHEQSLNDVLQKFASGNQKINITYRVKPDLLGGIVVTVGDKYVDLSVSSRLKKLQHVLETSI